MRSTTLAEFLTYRVKIVNLFHFALFLLVWHGIFSLCGLYVSKRLSTLYSEAIEVLKATTLSTVFLLAAGNVFHLHTITGRFAMAFWVIATLLIAVSRVVTRLFLRMLRAHGKKTRGMLILGT